MLCNLSVIIPNYNHSRYLVECFKRINLQTSLPQEIIIIDDGSSDNSIEVIEKELVKIKKQNPLINLLFIKNNKNKGVVYTENLDLCKKLAHLLKNIPSGNEVFITADDFLLLDNKTLSYYQEQEQEELVLETMSVILSKISKSERTLSVRFYNYIDGVRKCRI